MYVIRRSLIFDSIVSCQIVFPNIFVAFQQMNWLKSNTLSWEQRKLGEFFKKYQNTVYLQDEEEYRQISIRNTGVVEYRCTNKGKNIGRKRQYLIDTDTHPVTLTFTRQTVYEGGIGFVPKELNGAIVTENMPLLEMTNACQDFMKALFNTSGYYKSVINDDTLIGSAQKALHEKQWLDSYVCVPVLDEQKQIGSFFQQLDNLITLHQSKAESWKNKKNRFLTISWEQRKVGELTNVLSASRVHKEEWAEDGIPFFRSSDVVSAFKGTENEKAFISIELYEKLAKSSGKLEQNDILITGGGSIGIPYIVPDNKPLYSKDADLIWIKHSVNFDSRYLYTYFISEEFREYLASISHTGTIAHYTIEQVKDTPVRLPLIDEQRALGDFFVSLDHLM